VDHHHNSWDEHYHYQERKESRKERRIARTKDRSQFKKTDQDQKKKNAVVTRETPAGAKRGRVLNISSEGILVDCSGENYLCSLRGTLKQETARKKNLVAVGDFVCFLPELPLESRSISLETSDSSLKLEKLLGSILYIEERHSLLSRANRCKYRSGVNYCFRSYACFETATNRSLYHRGSKR
jgi:hypothetical protein